MPTKQQLSVFIDTFMKLSRFSESEKLPVSEIMVVLAWLHGLKETTEKETKVHNPNITPYSLMCPNCRDGRYPVSNDYCVCTSG